MVSLVNQNSSLFSPGLPESNCRNSKPSVCGKIADFISNTFRYIGLLAEFKSFQMASLASHSKEAESTVRDSLATLGNNQSSNSSIIDCYRRLSHIPRGEKAIEMFLKSNPLDLNIADVYRIAMDRLNLDQDFVSTHTIYPAAKQASRFENKDLTQLTKQEFKQLLKGMPRDTWNYLSVNKKQDYENKILSTGLMSFFPGFSGPEKMTSLQAANLLEKQDFSQLSIEDFKGLLDVVPQESWEYLNAEKKQAYENKILESKLEFPFLPSPSTIEKMPTNDVINLFKKHLDSEDASLKVADLLEKQNLDKLNEKSLQQLLDLVPQESWKALCSNKKQAYENKILESKLEFPFLPSPSTIEKMLPKDAINLAEKCSNFEQWNEMPTNLQIKYVKAFANAQNCALPFMPNRAKVVESMNFDQIKSLYMKDFSSFKKINRMPISTQKAYAQKVGDEAYFYFMPIEPEVIQILTKSQLTEIGKKRCFSLSTLPKNTQRAYQKAFAKNNLKWKRKMWYSYKDAKSSHQQIGAGPKLSRFNKSNDSYKQKYFGKNTLTIQDIIQHLGMKPKALTDEKVFKKEMRRLNKKLHPDRNLGNAVATEKFQFLSRAKDFILEYQAANKKA